MAIPITGGSIPCLLVSASLVAALSCTNDNLGAVTTPQTIPPADLQSQFGCTPPAMTVTPASLWHVRTKPDSAWTNLAPWAFWAVQQAQPRTLVELGTHNGYSYLTFCQAIAALQLPTRAFAVDTWRGDEHAGYYGESVYRSVQRCNNRDYAAFSTLLRMTFDEALQHFADGSVDFLHIDGQHFYEDIKHDFESWLPKLSDRAVVFFHDVDYRDRGFGVYLYWDELTRRYPHFTFRQGAGLGILGVGKDLPAGIAALLHVSDPAALQCIEHIYARLGDEAMAWDAPATCE